MMSYRISFLAILGSLSMSCTSQNTDNQQPSNETVFTNVSVIPMTDDQVLEDRVVVVKEGRIVAITTHEDAEHARDARVIDGRGKYLVPGLTEMHAHIPVPQPGPDRVKETLFLYLSNGITTIRGMLGHPNHLKLREEVMADSVLGPRIYTSGPSLNGNSVTSLEEARNKVTAQQQAGYDFLKLHPGIQRPVFDEIVKTAKEVGIPYAGHVSVDVGVRHAMNSDYASIDHVDGFLEGLVDIEGRGLDKTQNGFFGFNFTSYADASLISELVQLSKSQEVWVVPTQSLFDRWASPTDPELLAAEPEMKYMPRSTLENWVRSKGNLTKDPNYDSATWAAFNGIRQQLIKALHDSGQGLVLGSDAPQVFNVPGFSIHHELNGMILSGLTPYEALMIGTVNAARYFDKVGEFGQIVEGASADLILVNGNPLDDLNNLKNPSGVMVRGRWLDRDFLDKELDRIARVSANL